MAEKLGTGVSRTLSALSRNFGQVVWQKGKPPLDSELNLMSQIDMERAQELIRSQVHSGFFLDPTQASLDFNTNKNWSNFFSIGQATSEEKPFLWANVNGWVIPVAGTNLFAGMSENENVITLNPAPESDSRIDFVFLEAWTTLVAPNPSTENKPNASQVYRYGNVENGVHISDDIQDPTIGYETTERVQVQYRIRVFGNGAGIGSGLALDDFPDGLDDPNVLGQGTHASPIGGYTFTNMKTELGDPSLWRAGNGDPTNELGTIDGYTYAIPLCAIFRRNSSPFVAVESAGNANKNGGFDRNPSAPFLANPRTGAKILSQVSLTNTISSTDTGIIQVEGLIDSGIDDIKHNFLDFFLMIGDEIVRCTNFDSSTVPATLTITERGRYGTQAKRHSAGTSVSFFNSRADHKFADEIHSNDILDLRRSINIGDWDYTRLLMHNLRSLVQGTLKSSYKQAATGDTEGHTVLEVSYMNANGATAIPNQTEAVDGIDGIRTVWSDGAVIQSDITMLCDNDALPISVNGAVTDFAANTTWDVTPDFKPSGFTVDDTNFVDGTTVFLHIGGDDGNQGARYSFRDSSERKVRFVSPKELWNGEERVEGNQYPVKVRWIGDKVFNAPAGSETTSTNLGDMYPTPNSGFEKPFLFLGDLLDSALKVEITGSNLSMISAGVGEIDLGVDFDVLGEFYSLDEYGRVANDPDAISKPVLNGKRTLFGLLTDNGRDMTGLSSELYVVLYGDQDFARNNGAFKVIGLGTVGYSNSVTASSTSIRVQFLTTGASNFETTSTNTITCEMRSPYCTNKGGAGFANGVAAATITFTGLAEATSNWYSNSSTLDATGSSGREGYPSKMVIGTSVMYHSGRGAMARVPTKLQRFAVVNGGSEYLRQAPSSLDINFAPEAGVPANETFFDPTHVQVWNRLGSRGEVAPYAPSYGGKVVAFSEQDRECEVFFDKGSKSVVFRPFLDRSMTLHSSVIGAGKLIPTLHADGVTTTDQASLFEASLTMGFAIPPEFMPRFGRQDIPFYNDTTGDGSGTFLTGINHLFTDSIDDTLNAFYVIGGFDNPSGGNLVTSMLFQTGATSGLPYGTLGDITGGSLPPSGTSSYQARVIYDETVTSSDFGKGLRGIELPPFLGIARLYGVYDRRDYVNKGGATFESNRLTVAADPATNLLKTDAMKQTLFIRQGGGQDLTGSNDDHTYVVPSNLIDITRSPEWSEGENFQDLEYVVECVVFGFSRGFINKNTYVLARKHAGNGSALSTGTPLELENCHMTIPAPAPKGDQAYSLYERVVYQGDPYMTRAGATRTVSDYEHRYGEIELNDAQHLNNPIQQTDSNGNLIVERPNLRELQILASVDFYTTLGTGKVGGRLFKGTALDIGHKEPVGTRRYPKELQMIPRTFTEGQLKNTSVAQLRIWIEGTISPNMKVFVRYQGQSATIEESVDWSATGTSTVDAIALANAINAKVTTVFGNTPPPLIANALSSTITIESVYRGAIGNEIEIEYIGGGLVIDYPYNNYHAKTLASNTTRSHLYGGVDILANAGSGTSQLDITGLTERLPLGILLQDSDFLCENPLNDMASAFVTMPAGIRPPQTLLPLTDNAEEEGTRFLGVGQSIGLCDGGILQYEPYHVSTSPTGTLKFRTYRGGSAYVLSGEHAGSPIDFYSGALSASLNPVLKGGILAGKALLVRNYEEHAFSTNERVSTGDEIQMVIITYGLMGSPSVSQEGIDIQGLISPTGYGEGYASADRYRLEGKPMYKGRNREPRGLDTKPSIFPYEQLLDTPDLGE